MVNVSVKCPKCGGDIEVELPKNKSLIIKKCDKCGEDINIKRIEARPVTTMCIDCKTQQEEEEKLMEM